MQYIIFKLTIVTFEYWIEKDDDDIYMRLSSERFRNRNKAGIKLEANNNQPD